MMSDRRRQPNALIALLLDETAEFGDRDDAAMDLGLFDEESAEAALLRIATASHEDAELVEQCGESLAVIWCRKNKLDRTVMNSLQPPALSILTAYCRNHRPDWSF